MRIVALLLLLIVVVLGLVFAVLNAHPVELHYYFGTSESPLSLIVVLAFGVGVLLGIFSSLGIIVRLKRDASRLRKDVKLAEKEVSNLRNLPLRDTH